MTNVTEQAQADMDSIKAAREAVRIAAERIQAIRVQHMGESAEAALSDAEGMIMDAFDDATGTTVFELEDKLRYGVA